MTYDTFEDTFQIKGQFSRIAEEKKIKAVFPVEKKQILGQRVCNVFEMPPNVS